MVQLWPVALRPTGDVRVALVLTWSCAVGSLQGGTGQSVGPPPPPPPPELPPTVNVALRICVTLVVVTSRVVMVWLPPVSVPVLNPIALPLDAVPAKSSGAVRSVWRGAPAIVGASRKKAPRARPGAGPTQ